MLFQERYAQTQVDAFVDALRFVEPIGERAHLICLQRQARQFFAGRAVVRVDGHALLQRDEVLPHVADWDRADALPEAVRFNIAAVTVQSALRGVLEKL